MSRCLLLIAAAGLPALSTACRTAIHIDGLSLCDLGSNSPLTTSVTVKGIGFRGHPSFARPSLYDYDLSRLLMGRFTNSIDIETSVSLASGKTVALQPVLSAAQAVQEPSLRGELLKLLADNERFAIQGNEVRTSSTVPRDQLFCVTTTTRKDEFRYEGSLVIIVPRALFLFPASIDWLRQLDAARREWGGVGVRIVWIPIETSGVCLAYGDIGIRVDVTYSENWGDINYEEVFDFAKLNFGKDAEWSFASLEATSAARGVEAHVCALARRGYEWYIAPPSVSSYSVSFPAALHPDPLSR